MANFIGVRGYKEVDEKEYTNTVLNSTGPDMEFETYPSWSRPSTLSYLKVFLVDGKAIAFEAKQNGWFKKFKYYIRTEG